METLARLRAQRDAKYAELEAHYAAEAEKDEEGDEHKDEEADESKDEMADESKDENAESEKDEEGDPEKKEAALTASIKRIDARIERYHVAAKAKAKHDAKMAEFALTAGEGKSARPEGPGMPPRVRVVSEPKTYNAGGENSIFIDLFGSAMGNPDCMGRLNRHRQEYAAPQQRSGQAVLQPDGSYASVKTGGGLDTSHPTGTSMAGFIPPAYLLDMYADRITSGSPLLNNIRKMDMPADGMDILIPRITTPGGSTGPADANDLTAVQSGEGVEVRQQPVGTAMITIPVNTVAGEMRLSRQLVDRGRMSDEVAYKTLADDLIQKKDQYFCEGSGANNEPKGLSQAATAGTFASMVEESKDHSGFSLTELFPLVTKLEAEMHQKRFVAPNLVAMRPNLWGAIKGSLDGDGRPQQGIGGSVRVNTTGESNENRELGIKGEINGLPVCVDPNLALVGAATDQSPFYMINTDDILYWEGGVSTIAVDQARASNLEISIVLYLYVALCVEYRQASIGRVKGTLLKV